MFYPDERPITVYPEGKIMRKIEYGFNSYHKTASINVDFAPFWMFALDRLVEGVCGYLVPPTPFPHIKSNSALLTIRFWIEFAELKTVRRNDALSISTYLQPLVTS